MTNLLKGIIEIDGFEIGPNTKPEEIENELASKIQYKATSKSGEVQIFAFKNVLIVGRSFAIDLTFIKERLSDIRLDYMNDECWSFKKRYDEDCRWLRDVLGEPTIIGSHQIAYKFDAVSVRVTHMENDPRSGSDEWIDISFK